MQRSNRTHANPGISTGQAKAVQNKAKAMGLGETTRHADIGNEAKSKPAGDDHKSSSTKETAGQDGMEAKDARTENDTSS